MANYGKRHKLIPMFGTGRKDVTADDVLMKGITIKQASILFGIHNTELSNLVVRAKLKPSGERSGNNIYSIPDLASLCVPPKWTHEEWEEVLHKGHFPTTLKKDFWNARQARLKYLLEAGELWHTSEVIASVAELNKTFAMGVRLIPDQLDRITSLTVEQRNLITEMLDDVLRNVAKNVNETFSQRGKLEAKVRYEDLTAERYEQDDNPYDI